MFYQVTAKQSIFIASKEVRVVICYIVLLISVYVVRPHVYRRHHVINSPYSSILLVIRHPMCTVWRRCSAMPNIVLKKLRTL